MTRLKRLLMPFAAVALLAVAVTALVTVLITRTARRALAAVAEDEAR